MIVSILVDFPLDNGELIDRPRFLDIAIGNIKRLQRELSRKKKGSKHRQKAKIALAQGWRKVRLQRDDYCQKATTSLTKRFGIIVFEKLSIPKMVKNHKLAGKILELIYRCRGGSEFVCDDNPQ
ncbi:MAG: transposase [Candidatus Nitrosopolaris sp.]